MRHLWADKRLHINLRIRLYKSCVCSILTWGSETWKLTDKVQKMLNGANSQMLCIITGKTPREEATQNTTSFNLVMWIRSRRLQWTGHIMRMGPERKVKQAVYEIFRAPSEGDLLMDVPKVSSWRQLGILAFDKEGWRARVRALRGQAGVAPVVTATTPPQTQTQPQCKPKPVKPATAKQTAARYKKRDEREMFFRLAKGRKVKKKTKKKKTKRKQLTDKERRQFARDHYARHHTNTNTPAPDVPWSPIVIEGHHKCTHTTPNHQHNQCTPCHQLNQTIPITPPTLNSMCLYMNNLTQDHNNLGKFTKN